MKRVLAIAFLLLVAACSSGCGPKVSTEGDYTLKSGRTLERDLIVTSGTTTIEEEARVDGDVMMTSGVLRVDGEIDGDVFMTSGTIRVGSQGVVRGDVIWTSGDIVEEPGSRIEGSVPEDTGNSDYGDIAGFFIRNAGGYLLVPLIIFLVFVIVWIVLIVVLARKATRKPQAQEAEPVEQMKLLKQRFEEGSISAEEFEARKQEILSRF